ncbi:MAG: hypothetical protein J1E01_12880 [Acetatifactor sp.]|nr:hypothetical protein [Acetatifactor sp.]
MSSGNFVATMGDVASGNAAAASKKAAVSSENVVVSSGWLLCLVERRLWAARRQLQAVRMWI